jgi:hypothetical protein
MAKLKSFLENNKIFFETIATFAISGMAVIVSFSSNSIQSKQAEILSKQIQPQFIVENNTHEEFASSSVDAINVFNHGGLFRDISVEPFLFYDVKLYQEDRFTEVLLPFDTYYTFSEPLEGNNGLVYKNFSDPDKYSKLVELSSNFSSEAERKGISPVSLEVQKYIRIQYQDLFGKYNTEYYSVSNLLGSALLDNEKGEELFRLYSKTKRLDFDVSGPGIILENALDENLKNCRSLQGSELVVRTNSIDLTSTCIILSPM